MRLLLCSLFAIFHSSGAQHHQPFSVIRQWKYLNFTWPSAALLQDATAQGLYIPENNVLAGIKYHDNHYYVTLPRMKRGVPATLARIPAGPTQDTAPALEPYPSWGYNQGTNCTSLQNVQNVEVDAKGRLWIIDGGRVDTLETAPVARCPPKILIHDIAQNQSVKVYEFPEDVAPKEGSFLYDLVVDDTDGGYAYVTDNSAHAPGIIVYSLKENRSWRVNHAPSMMADPTATQFTVNGITVSAPINLAGIALGPKVHTSAHTVIAEDREVFFSALSSLHLYSINTTALRNETLAKSISPNYAPYIKDIGLKASQGVGMIMDNQGVLYYGLLANSEIAQWDSHTPFQNNQRIISRDVQYIEWPNSFTFDQAGNLTVLVNRMDKFIFQKLDLSEWNFRLLRSHVGGKSYVYDEHYYDAEPKAEPEPTAEPRPSSTTIKNPTARPVTAGAERVSHALALVIATLLVIM